MKRYLFGDEPKLLKLAKAHLKLFKSFSPRTCAKYPSFKMAAKIVEDLSERPSFCQFCAQPNAKEHTHEFCPECDRIDEHCECATKSDAWPSEKT